MNKAVYIGAGTDLIPVIIVDEIKEFIYIDSQPFSEYGTLIYDIKKDLSYTVEKKDRIENSFSRNCFLSNLYKIMDQIQFKLIESNDDFLLFKNNDRSIKYYYSCAFPEYINDNIIDDIKTCDTIIMAGHDPNKIIFNYLQNPINFIGDSHTSYCHYNKKDEQYIDSSFEYIINNPKIINKYYIMKEINEYNYWEDHTQTYQIKSNFELIELKKLDNIKSI